MFKALIFSDSHGYLGEIWNAIAENPDTDLIIHAGDMQRDVDDIMAVYPNIPCAYVVGNNEHYIQNACFDRLFEFGGKKIFLTHGHSYGVKLSYHRVISEARSRGADVCIFGHTHTKLLEKGDLWVVNPGPARRSYAILTINNGEISVTIHDI